MKPNNIRIDEQSDKYDEHHPNYYNVNMIDFGFGILLKNKKQKEVQLSRIKGTLGYIAPETINNRRYSHKSDMFQLR